jgi:hypothetical protein
VSLANRDGTFRAGPTYDTGTTPNGLVSGDFNDDGNADVALITQNRLIVLLGNGEGSFRPGFTFAFSLPPDHIAIADFNQDGKEDLAVIAPFQTGPLPMDRSMEVIIFYGDGSGGFTTPAAVFSTPDSLGYPVAFVTGDFDGDHHADIAFTFSTLDRAELGTTESHVLYGLGNGSFVPTQATYVLAVTDEIAADVNSDGRSDLLMSFNGGPNFSEGIAILYGTGARTFVRKDLDQPAAYLGVVDFNGDGRNDVVATFSSIDSQSGVSVFLQQSDGTFSPPQQFIISSADELFIPDLAVGDFNDDGKPDIALPALSNSSTPNDLFVELKNTTPPTTPVLTAFSPLNGTSISSSFWVRVNAASAMRITGMIVYLDGVRAYVTTQSFVDAVLPLTSGTHRVTVRAWNNIGQFGTYTASIHGVGSTSTVPLLQVRSPGNNTLVPSPVWVRVNATSTAGITGLIVYIDSVPKFTTTAATVDKTFPVGTGTHFVTVRGWNSKGEFSTYHARIGVP